MRPILYISLLVILCLSLCFPLTGGRGRSGGWGGRSSSSRSSSSGGWGSRSSSSGSYGSRWPSSSGSSSSSSSYGSRSSSSGGGHSILSSGTYERGSLLRGMSSSSPSRLPSSGGSSSSSSSFGSRLPSSGGSSSSSTSMFGRRLSPSWESSSSTSKGIGSRVPSSIGSSSSSSSRSSSVHKPKTSNSSPKPKASRNSSPQPKASRNSSPKPKTSRNSSPRPKGSRKPKTSRKPKASRNSSPKPNTLPESVSRPSFFSNDVKLTPPPSTVLNKQPAYNPNYREPSAPVDSKLPSVSVAQAPSYQSASNQPGQNNGHLGVGSAAYPQQSAIPKQQSTSLQQPYDRSSFPQQPGIVNPHPFPAQPQNAKPYPVQPGFPSMIPVQPGQTKPYPVQPGFPSMIPVQPVQTKPYPVQPNFHGMRPLGANVWHAQSGVPAPAYMNYGGLPTGTNMQVKTHKKKGLLGSLMTGGISQHKVGKFKYYNSYQHPYGQKGFETGKSIGLNTFVGKHGNPATMYTILPYMISKKSSKLFRPRFGYHYGFFHRHHYHHHHHHYGHGFGNELEIEKTRYDILKSDDYVGQCQRPLSPKNTTIECNSTSLEVSCKINCTKGYQFPDKSSNKENKCWHVTGVWRPMKNFPACEPACNETCLNGGICIGSGMCRCKSDYRGSRCEYHYLKCDIKKLISGSKSSWTCTHKKNGTSCTVKCRPPAEFETPAASEYTCTLDGQWTPNSIPECVVKETTTEVLKETSTEILKETKTEDLNETTTEDLKENTTKDFKL